MSVPTAHDLPDAITFPEPGSPEFETVLALSQRDILRLGIAEDGEWLDWDLRADAHAVFGAGTGPWSESVRTIVVFYLMYRSLDYKLTICGPVPADMEWVREFATVRFATTGEEVAVAVAAAASEAEERLAHLEACGTDERDPIHAVCVTSWEQFPRRILLFTEPEAAGIATASEGRTGLAFLGGRGGQVAINLLFAGPRWTAERLPAEVAATVGLQLEVPAAEVPRGRILAMDALTGSRQAQVMYLPAEARVCPWDPSEPMKGAATMLRARMADFEFS